MTRADLAEGHDTTERLSPDDMATLREEQHLQAALLRQRQLAARHPRDVPGICSNCAERCLPLAVYCDEDCREDHQHRLGVLAKQQARR